MNAPSLIPLFSAFPVFSHHRHSEPVNAEKSRQQMHRVWSLLLTWHWNQGGVNPPRLRTGPGFLSGWTLTDDACSARRIAHKTVNDLLTAAERRVRSPRSRAARPGRPAPAGTRWEGPRHSPGHKLFKETSPGSLRTTFLRRLSTRGAAVRMATFPTPTGVMISGWNGWSRALRAALRRCPGRNTGNFPWAAIRTGCQNEPWPLELEGFPDTLCNSYNRPYSRLVSWAQCCYSFALFY